MTTPTYELDLIVAAFESLAATLDAVTERERVEHESLLALLDEVPA